MRNLRRPFRPEFLWPAVSRLMGPRDPSVDRVRHGRHLLAGLPVALAALLSIIGYVAVQWESPRETAIRYRQAAAHALDTGDLATARLAFERREREEPADAECQYGLALTFARLGDARAAIELLDRLAPLDLTDDVLARTPDADAGFAPAHLALGRELLAATRPSAQVLTAAERHLRFAAAFKPGPVAAEANAILGRFYAVGGRWELARTHLHSAIMQSGSDELALMLAQVNQRLGDADAVTTWAGRAAEHWAKRAAADPRDVRARIARAEALVLLLDYPKAVASLEQGMLNSPNDGALDHAAAQACAAWLAALEASGSKDVALAVGLLRRGLAHDPANAALLERVVALVRTGAAGEDGHALLNDLVASGRGGPGATAVLHLILGTTAFGEGKADEARVHFEQAHALDPGLAAVANNLAYLLAFGPPPVDPKRALALAESAVAGDPKNPSYLDTRGRVYAKLGRWREAVTDLERALPYLNEPRPAHAALADSYHALGIPDLAAAHHQSAMPSSAPIQP